MVQIIDTIPETQPPPVAPAPTNPNVGTGSGHPVDIDDPTPGTIPTAPSAPSAPIGGQTGGHSVDIDASGPGSDSINKTVTLGDGQQVNKEDYDRLPDNLKRVAKKDGIRALNEAARRENKQNQLEYEEAVRYYQAYNNELESLADYKSPDKVQVNPVTGKTRIIEAGGYDIAKYLRDGKDPDKLIRLGFTPETIKAAEDWNNRKQNLKDWSRQYYEDRGWNYDEKEPQVTASPASIIPGAKERYADQMKAREEWGNRMREATNAYIAKYGKGDYLGSVGANTLTPLFTPARALAPDVTIKDISRGEWVMGAAQVALFVVAPVAGSAIKGAGGVLASKAIQLGAGAVFLKDTVDNWSNMSPTERGIAVAMDTLIIGSALPKDAIIKGAKSAVRTGGRIIDETVTNVRLNPEAGFIKADLPDVVTSRIKSFAKVPPSIEAELGTEFKNLQNAISSGDDWAVSMSGKRLKQIADKIDDIETRNAIKDYASKLETKPESYIDTVKSAKDKVTPDQVSNNVNTVDKVNELEKVKQKAKTQVITKEKPKIEGLEDIKPKTPPKIEGLDKIKPKPKEPDFKWKPKESPKQEPKWKVDEAKKASEKTRQEAIEKFRKKIETEKANKAKTEERLKENVKQQGKIQEKLKRASKTKTKPVAALALQLQTKQKEQTELALRLQQQAQTQNELETELAVKTQTKPATETETEIMTNPYTETKPQPQPYPELNKPPDVPKPDEPYINNPNPKKPEKGSKEDDGKKRIDLSLSPGKDKPTHTAEDYANAVTWKQGLGYWIVFPDKTTEFSRTKPDGVREVAGPNANKPKNTIQLYRPKDGGKTTEFKADMGAVDVEVSKTGEKIVNIRFRSDPKELTNNPVRLGHPSNKTKKIRWGRGSR